VELRLLGPVEVLDGGRAVAITASKQRAVLALLALQAGRVVPLDALVDRLWEDPPASASHAVRVYVSALRRGLPSGERLLQRHRGYLLDVAPEAVDAFRFERLARDARSALAAGAARHAVSQLQQALALWRGPALADAREGSLRLEAARLDEARLVAHEAYLEAQLRLGELDSVLTDVDRLLAEHPLRSQFVRTIMLARYRAGRQADALAAYRDYRLRLDAELGLAPDASLRELEAAILRDEVEPAPAGPASAGGDAERAALAIPAEPPEPRLPVPAPLGRDNEHEAVVAFLDAVAEGPAALVISGEAGIGKTTVWEAGLAEACNRSYQVLAARARASEIALSFAGLVDLLDPVVGRVLPELPAPQRRAFEAALALAESDAAPDQRVLALAMRSALRAVSDERPLLIAVDDLHWLDEPSAQLLAFALRRLGHARVGLLASLRAEPGAAVPFELDRAFAQGLERLEIGPLSLGALQRLLRERLSRPLPRPLLRRIHDRSGGNPFYALELARALAERGEERLPPSLRALVANRVERLPAPTRTLLVSLSVAADPTRPLVRALGGVDLLEPAEREGIVVVEGSRLRFAHPLLAAAVLDGATSRERRDAHRRLAELVDDAEQRARHLALAAEGPDEEVAAALDSAAAAAFARGALAAAAELAERALALTVPSDQRATHRRRLAAARRNQTLGNTARQRELLEQALAAATTDLDRAEPLWQLGTLVMQEGGDRARARAMVEEGLACAAGDDALSATILMETSWLDHGFYGGIERAQAAVAHAERAGDPRLLAMALGALGGATFSQGLGLARHLFERAIALERQVGFIDATDRPTTNYGWAAKWAGDIALSRELLEEAVARALEADDATADAPLFYLSWLHVISGEWERALERADESWQLSVDAGLEKYAATALMTRAVVDAYRGRLDDARKRLDETAALQEAREPVWAFGAALVALSAGDPAAAAAALGPAIAQMRDQGIEEPGLYPWFPTLAEALVQLGRLDEAEELTGWLEARAVRLERRWALAMCAHYRGVIAAARGDVDTGVALLECAVEWHEGVGRPFDRALTLLAQGQTLRRARRKRDSRTALEDAAAEFERLGATLWAEKARAELERTGGHSAPTNELTATEARVAALVATGKSNKEVAAQLYVTVRTVETTLSRIYAKLGVRSRVELARRVGSV
jgi:DNA-binding SARP family transcriptional activator/DNA-binding CsgD family transcriptional regulator